MSSARALNAILPQIPVAPYEAHQKARTFASRYVKSGQYDTAIDVLFQSARELLKTGQPGSGVDLASFMLEVYDTKEERVSAESRGRVTQLIALTGSDADGSWRKTLIDRAVAWSAKHGEHPAGDPELNYYVGSLFEKEGAYDIAEPYLLSAGSRDSARLLAEAFLKWGAPTDTFGLFALRGVIPFLENGNVLAAKAFIKHFVAGLPSSFLTTSAKIPAGESDEVVMTTDSLLNFSQMAVVTCQRAQGDKSKVPREAWVRLCGTYQSKGGPLTAPGVRRALTEIATLYFAIPPPRGQAGNPMADMLSSLFGGAPSSSGQAPRRTLTPSGPSNAGLD